MKTATIYHHLGMGDEIICNGLMREIANDMDFILTFSKIENTESVKFMYRDLLNVKVVSADYSEINRWITESNPKNLIMIGDGGFGRVPDGMPFSEWFYWQAGLTIKKRWDSFHVVRDIDREDKFFDNMMHYHGIEKGEKFAVAHDDYRFKINRLETDLKCVFVHPKHTSNIFDWCLILEKASEIHCIESSIMFLADSITTRGKLFAHRYARKYPPDNAPNLLKQWEILQ